MATEVAANLNELFNAVAKLTPQVQTMATVQSQPTPVGGGGGDGGPRSGGGRPWDGLERFKNLQVFDGSQKTYE